jgi:non-ribosomal peptide synthetase component E (peptide arylation enzyme)
MDAMAQARCWHGPADARRFRGLGVWGVETLAEIVDRHAWRCPDKLAVADASLRWTYGELTGLSSRVAQVLLTWGVRPGDVVAVQVPNSAVLPLVHLACVRIGAVFVPLSISWRRAEIRALLTVTQAVVLIAAPLDGAVDLRSLHAELRPDLPDLREVVVAAGLLELAAAGESLTAEQIVALRPDSDAVAHVMVSSGTTGVPKASLWSGNNVVAMLVHHTGSALQLGPDDVAGALAPAGLGSTGYVFPILAPLLVGASCVILESWSAAAALALIAGERCTYVTAVPTQLIDLLEVAVEEADLSSLTRVNNAGAPLPAAVAEQVEARMGCRVQTIYGATDGGVPTMTAVTDSEAQRWTSVGRVQPGQEVRLTGPDGATVGAGETGEIWWRGATKSYGYLNQPYYDAAAFTADGWFRSGDLGTIDADGFLHIVGRCKDMILRGGMNIYPQELEVLLHQVPGVSAAAVVAIPDDRLGERACAVVVCAGEAPTLAELTEFLYEQGLAMFKHPEFLVLIDRLPVNAGGKVDKARLTEHALAELTPPAAQSDQIAHHSRGASR